MLLCCGKILTSSISHNHVSFTLQNKLLSEMLHDFYSHTLLYKIMLLLIYTFYNMSLPMEENSVSGFSVNLALVVYRPR